MQKYIAVFVVLVSLVLDGCNGMYRLKEGARRDIGTPLKNFLEVEKNPSGSPCVQKWRDKGVNKDYYLPNGNLVHVHPVACGCIAHWEFDKDTRLLIGYRFEGEQCSSL